MAVNDSFSLSNKTKENALISSILSSDKPITSELYQAYADNFRRAVSAVPIDDQDLSAQWNANVARFAAYKAYHATQEIRRMADEEDGDLALIKATLHKYNRYQAAEYNTAVARARTGKQWLSFNESDNARLFPYIEWLPSRSATPREAHRIFWNCRWPKGDPFWKENQPGTLWNCKCDWQETDVEPDPQKNKTALDKAEEMKQIAAEAHKPNPLCLPGLDKNPATSGQIFTDSAPYIKKAPKKTEDFVLNVTRTDNLKWALENLKGTSVSNKSFPHPISFTGSGLKDYINQPIDEPILKNEFIRQMPKLIKDAQYLGYSDYKSSEFVRHSHIFEMVMANKKRWLIVKEYTNNDIAFYSISSSPEVLNGLIKAKHPTA